MAAPVVMVHHHTQAELTLMSVEQRRELAGKLAAQQRSPDALHRSHAERLLKMIREADAATVDRRVRDARAFLFPDADASVAKRTADARKFLHRS